jgi:type III pantothenate kinase
MSIDLVVDVGNSRMKWGRCQEGRVADTAALSHDPSDWQRQFEAWELSSVSSWAVSSVQPQRAQEFLGWLHQGGQEIVHLSSSRQLPLKVQVEFPDRVGMDRLLNAVAANAKVGPGASRLIVDAGTAITVDWVDDRGAFRGGAIMPGLRLMAQALHEHTALLPLVPLPGQTAPSLPGVSTIEAIQAGIFWTAVGGIRALIGRMIDNARLQSPQIFLTGGDAGLIQPALGLQSHYWPQMTLEGIRMAAEGRNPGG